MLVFPIITLLAWGWLSRSLKMAMQEKDISRTLFPLLVRQYILGTSHSQVDIYRSMSGTFYVYSSLGISCWQYHWPDWKIILFLSCLFSLSLPFFLPALLLCHSVWLCLYLSVSVYLSVCLFSFLCSNVKPRVFSRMLSTCSSTPLHSKSLIFFWSKPQFPQISRLTFIHYFNIISNLDLIKLKIFLIKYNNYNNSYESKLISIFPKQSFIVLK